VLFLVQLTAAIAKLWAVKLGSDSGQRSGSVRVGPGLRWPSLVAVVTWDSGRRIGWVLPCFATAGDRALSRTLVQVGTSKVVYSQKWQADYTAQKYMLVEELNRELGQHAVLTGVTNGERQASCS
jgi:hypothetical protein